MQQLILASSSPYRKELLNRLTQDFFCVSPNIDERLLPEESAGELVKRLSIEKAQAVAKEHPDALIIGSDQVCEFINPSTGKTEIAGKPENHVNAIAHLQAVSGKTVYLRTGLTLYNAKNENTQSTVESYSITFRELSKELIEQYLHSDQPYDCAGAVKVESQGIILIEKMEGKDPNSIIGLPLIALTNMLNNEKFSLFTQLEAE